MTDLIIPGGVAASLVGVASLWIRAVFYEKKPNGNGNGKSIEKMLDKLQGSVDDIKKDVGALKVASEGVSTKIVLYDERCRFQVADYKKERDVIHGRLDKLGERVTALAEKDRR